jgi:hypothetical protein
MGGTNGIVYDFSYQRERSEVRAALIRKFEQDPASQDVIGKIRALRALIIECPHINATAATEQSKGEDVETGMTSFPAAFNELDRLFTLYETSTILRSSQCRIGNVACPLGHFASYFDDFKVLMDGKKQIECNMCGKKPKDGYHCSYCQYSLCVPCSVVYCENGHACKLWTHAESQHFCYICKKQPITSGYRCLICEDHDICDYCSYKEGRKFIQGIIVDRVKILLDYIDRCQEESETALKTINGHRKKMAENSYASILELYQFCETLRDVKMVVKAEVRQTRITKAIIKLREELVVGKEFSKTAYEESLVVDRYTKEEQERLQAIYDRHMQLKSVVSRDAVKWACPLGHAFEHYENGIPLYYAERLLKRKQDAFEAELRDIELKRKEMSDEVERQREEMENKRKQFDSSVAGKVTSMFRSKSSKDPVNSRNESPANRIECSSGDKANECKESPGSRHSRNKNADNRSSPTNESTSIQKWDKDTTIPRYKKKRPELEEIFVYCQVCNRLAKTAGYHCDYCEYDVCETCAVIFDHEGHEMTLWTEPTSFGESCFLCKRDNIIMGYRCVPCNVNLCDFCTTKEMRNRIRTDWEGEMNSLLEFMKENKRLSDIAMYYQWRFSNHITSIGRLVDYVHELRTAKERAIKQIEQKPIIDKIKTLRSELAKYSSLCKAAERELARMESYVFPTKKIANAELRRLAELLKAMVMAQTTERRNAAGIACPLGHAMDIIPMNEGLGDVIDEEVERTVPEGVTGGVANSLAISVATPTKESSEPSKFHVPAQQYAKPPMDPTDARTAVIIAPLKDAKSELISLVNDTMNNVLVAPVVDTNPDAVIGTGSISVTALTPLEKFPRDPNRLEGTPLHPTTPMKTRTSLFFTDRSSQKTGSSPTPGGRYIHVRHGRACRVCASLDLWSGSGHRCGICEYDLCGDCSTVYCRQGHPLRIWTMPEAITLQCDMCKAQPLTAGYRCVLCNIDICDGCTARDARNAFLLWPRREFHKLLQHMEHVAKESQRARDYLQTLQDDPDKSYLDTMSKLCRKLAEMQELKSQVDEDVKSKVQEKKIKSFAMLAREMY